MKLFVPLCLSLLLFTMLTQRCFAYEKEAGEAAKLASVAASFAFPQKAEDIRERKLKAFLKRYNSPLTPHASVFIEEADKHNIDWKLVASIAGLESTFGRFIPTNSYNAWGWGVFTGKSYGKNFESWEHGISTVTEGIKNNYINDGLVTVEQIGFRYAASPTWSYRVRYFMNQMEAITPPDNVIAMTL